MVLAAPRSFCAGVERAVTIVEKALETYGSPVYVRRQVVHNTHVMERLAAQADFGADAQRITLDGLRVECAHAWGLVRASNTTPGLVLRFEADTLPALADMQERFRSQLLRLQANLPLPF